MDLSSLLSQLQSTQQARVTARLSERNVIDLVNKLKQLGILGEELLYTINGKEYITTDQLRKEVALALRQSGGRLALVELPALVGCDLTHCERQAAAVVAESGGSVMEAQGELITQQYFDTIATEINDLLQEAGQIGMSELAIQYALHTELLASMLQSRIGTTIKGRLEAGLLYTSSYLRNIKAVLRGALRGVAEPTTMTNIIKELRLESAALGGSGGVSVVASIVDELIKEGALAGSLKGGGVNWVPSVYSTAQKSAVHNFYEQNGWVDFDTAKRMGIPNASSYLRTAFPDAIPLETALVGPSLLSQLEGAVEEPLAAGAPPCWVDVSTLLPSVLTPGDMAALLARIPQLSAATAAAEATSHKPHTTASSATKSGGAAPTPAAAGGGAGAGVLPGAAGRAHVLAGTCVVSEALVEEAEAAVCARARQSAEHALMERRRASSAAASTSAAGPLASAKGAPAAADKGQAAGSSDDEDWAVNAKKVGKSGRGGKAGGKAGKRGGGAGKTAKGGGGAGTAGKAPNSTAGAPGQSIADIEAQVLELRPDLEGAGLASQGSEGAGGAVTALASMLQPAAIAAYEHTLSAALTTSAEEKRRAKDALAQALDAAYQRLSLYAIGVEDFATPADTAAAAAVGGGSGEEVQQTKGGKGGSKAAAASAMDSAPSSSGQQQQQGGESVYPTLVRHALRTTGAEALDLLCKWVHVEFEAGADKDRAAGVSQGSKVGDLVKGPPLTQAERATLQRAVPQEVGSALSRASEAIASAPSIKDAVSILGEAAQDVGLRLRPVDKKSEKTVLSQLRAELLGALSSEHDPAAALALVVPLLYMRATGKAVAVPGKALGAVIARCGSSGSGAKAASGLSPENLATVEAFHAQVVDHLVSMGKPEAASHRASVAEKLAQQLPSIKALTGLQTDA